MAVVVQWTGWEAAHLGKAMRLSIREYARQLGVNPATVMKWRKRGRAIELMPETADILDAMLRRCDDEVLATFRAALGSDGGPGADDAESAPLDLGLPLGPARVVSHKFVPVYIGDGVRPLFTEAEVCPLGPGGLEHRALPAGHPDAAAESRLHLFACGVAVFHLVQPRTVASLGELAAWRYRSYLADLEWATAELRRLLALADSSVEAGATYVLSAYLLEDSPWKGHRLETALQVLTTPSVVVDRHHPDGPQRLGDDVERGLFAAGYSHPDAVDFGIQAVSMGLAGWSGVAYHPLAVERALPMDAIVALELDVQTLWALSTYVLDEIEAGRDPVMPDEAYGWRWLRGACSRLTAARPRETAQHQLMREAVLATSQLPDRLRAAQEALRASIA
ncbi:XRE family transcriptional regulator [Streptomyces sp. CC224B]|uniref:XRE family transcriptional regulator n=1 Tax=Streptomyces sp. CC224B TaxID=3044571 RepID=UPI0024A8A0BC|nr:XRE family transcriptional regulator [Streptomyces sp. CC224B]